MPNEKQARPARTTVCTHCESYAAEFRVDTKPFQEGAKTTSAREGEELCGNCNLLPPQERDAHKRLAVRLAEGRAKADAAAKKAFIDEIRKANEEEVSEVLGDDNKAARKAGAE